MAAAETYQCPFCGGKVTVGAPCAGCAKKHPDPAPWAQDEIHDGLDLPDEDFDYDEFVAREFGHVPHRKLGVHWGWWMLGVVILVVMIYLIAIGRW